MLRALFISMSIFIVLVAIGLIIYYEPWLALLTTAGAALSIVSVVVSKSPWRVEGRQLLTGQYELADIIVDPEDLSYMPIPMSQTQPPQITELSEPTTVDELDNKEKQAIKSLITNSTDTEMKSRLERLFTRYLALKDHLVKREDQFIPLTDIALKEAIVFLKCYQKGGQLLVVPFSSYITSITSLKNTLKHFTEHPLTKERFDSPAPYTDPNNITYPTKFCWHRRSDYKFTTYETIELAAALKALIPTYRLIPQAPDEEHISFTL